MSYFLWVAACKHLAYCSILLAALSIHGLYVHIFGTRYILVERYISLYIYVFIHILSVYVNSTQEVALVALFCVCANVHKYCQLCLCTYVCVAPS